MEKNKIEKLSEKLISSREKVRLSFSETDFRLQTVLMHQGIEWINDSKSTTIKTSAYSLEVIQKPVVWIVGANQQKQDFSMVENASEPQGSMFSLFRKHPLLKSDNRLASFS